MSIRVLISGGGTGGHIYPCLSVARCLIGGPPPPGETTGAAERVEILYVGGPRPIDRRLVEEAGLPFVSIPAGGLRGVGLRAVPNAARLVGGLGQAAGVLRRFRPNVALVSGGYVCAPVVAACAALRVPLVVLTVEIDQGWVNTAAARVAQAVTASFEPALAHLPPDRTTLTGYPVREEFLHADRDRARASLAIDPTLPALAVFGGSQGSQRINEALSGALATLLPVVQVLHVCGEEHLPALLARIPDLPEMLRPRYRLFGYLPAQQMADLLATADLALCRAGAAPLAELPLLGVPAILVPGRFSSQAANARYLREQGAAEVIDDAALTADVLSRRVLTLLEDRSRLAQLTSQMRSLARPDAAAAIAAVVRRVAGVGRL